MMKPAKVLTTIMLMAVALAVGCTSEDHDANVRVTTFSPQDITATTAVCGGDVIVTQGLSPSQLGVCWSENLNPTVEDSHLSTSNWSEPYVCTITRLDPNTKYHVRAYALRGMEYYYGEDKSFTTESHGGGDNAPSVTTASVTNITANSAKCGGKVTNDGGSSVTVRGICWSTSQMPTINDSHVNCGSGTGTFEGEMLHLSENTNYYVRAFATNSVGTSYGEEVSFHTEKPVPIYTIEVFADPSDYGEVNGGGSYPQGVECTLTATVHGGCYFTNWTENGEVASTDAIYSFTVTESRTLVANFTIDENYGVTYVDLGLPSGLLWATCNVGAENPEDYGDYFAWGETQPKDNYDWSSYQYCNGDYNTMTKYCTKSIYGYNGFTDTLTTLLPEDDAATAQWGDDWRMPTEAEWEEMYNNTTGTWITQNGVKGWLFTASNGNSLFLPAAGYRSTDTYYYAGARGFYWSSSLSTSYLCDASHLFFFYITYSMSGSYRCCGQPVRPVRVWSRNR